MTSELTAICRASSREGAPVSASGMSGNDTMKPSPSRATCAGSVDGGAWLRPRRALSRSPPRISQGCWRPVALQALVKNLGKAHQSDAKCIGPPLEFNDVETADASLALADEGLVLANTLSELDLAHLDPFASCPKLFKEVEVLGSMKRLGHRRPAWATVSFNAMFDYAKIAFRATNRRGLGALPMTVGQAVRGSQAPDGQT